ncbi:conserved hypothetical protein [Cotesia vestalis bracovirus]|nr:conserved hypothetical protein [Cotesia vestalis bracovirus]
MKCYKRLLVCLIFQALLIISEAGRNVKQKNPKFSLAGSGHGARGTSPGRSNSGRMSPTQVNGGNQFSGASHPNKFPVRPTPVGAPSRFNSQPPATLPLNRPQAPGPLDWSKLRFAGTGPQVRFQAPGIGSQIGPHNSGTGPWFRFQTPGIGPQIRPDNSGASASHAPQTPIHSPPGTSSIGHSESLTNMNFPSLAPKPTDFGAEIGRLDRSSSGSSSSLGYHSGSRSSISSIGSTRVEPVGLEAPKSTAIMKSAAHPEMCVDNTKTTPKIIAPAEHCFDYFKLAVAWNPGMAYKLWVTGYEIRTHRIRPSWIIHGLWPTMFARSQDPMPGCRRYDITFNRYRFVNHKILGVLDNIWDTLLAKGWSDNKKFWEHEFYKHGSCASRSSVIKDDVDYFKRSLELHAQLDIGMTLSRGGIKVGVVTKLRNIVDVIEKKVGATVKIDYVQNPMIRRRDDNRRAFYVVEFIELPFEGIDDYVCVPCTWMIVRKATEQNSVVAYPKREDPFVTRDRVKSKERCNNDWGFYVATVKYETGEFKSMYSLTGRVYHLRSIYGSRSSQKLRENSHRDAEDWIARINNYGPFVEEGLNTTDTEPKFPLNKKLRIANRSHSSKLNDNSRKPLPRISIKRPALVEPNKQLDGKRMKLDDVAQSSSAVVTDANTEPGSSRQEQSIIAQDNQPMESAQTETTASDSNGTARSSQQNKENLQQSLPIQEQQQSSIPSIDVNTPILVIDDDEGVRPTSIKEQRLPSNQAISQFTKQPESIREPQIVAAPSIEINQKLDEKQIRLVNIERNLDIAAQNRSNLMDQTRMLSTRSVKKQSSLITQNQLQDDTQLHEMSSGSCRKSTALLRNMAMSPQQINDVSRMNLNRSQNVSTVDPRIIDIEDRHRSLPNQQHSPTQSFQNQYITTNQNNFEQDLLRKSAESNNYKQRQSQPSQQDSQRQSRKPKIPIGISTKPKNNQQTPTHQVTKETLSPILTKVLNSLRQALSTTHSQYLLNDQQFQGNHTERAPVNENHLNEIDNTMQTDTWVEEETPSVHHGANSNSETVSDHEGISDHEMSTDEAPIERTNNFDSTGISSGSSYADRPIAAQNSTIHQTHSKVVLEQQMLDNFAELFTQMGSTLRYTCDMYNTLRSSILETAKTYKKLLGAVEQFNSTQNPAGSESFSINLKPGKRQTEVTASTSSSTQNQQSNDDANKTPKKKHNSWRIVLPPDYDPHDTRWTLKYRTNLPGLAELMPQTGVYVSYGDLIYCQQVSKDCKSLALRLLTAVFNRKALSVCLSMTEKVQAPDDVGSNIRPELDDHACSALLNFVVELGLQRGWNTDLQPILSTLHSKIQEIRSKYGVVVQC